MAGAKGSVTLSSGARPVDPGTAGDKADITLHVTGAAVAVLATTAGTVLVARCRRVQSTD